MNIVKANPRYLQRCEELGQRRKEWFEKEKQNVIERKTNHNGLEEITKDNMSSKLEMGTSTNAITVDLPERDKDDVNLYVQRLRKSFDIYLLEGALYLGTGSMWNDFVLNILNNHTLLSCIYCYERSSYKRYKRGIVYVTQHSLAFVLMAFTNALFEGTVPINGIYAFNSLVNAPLTKMFSRRAHALLISKIVLERVLVATALICVFIALIGASILSAQRESYGNLILYLILIHCEATLYELILAALAFIRNVHVSIYFNHEWLNSYFSMPRLDISLDYDTKITTVPFISITMGEYFLEQLLYDDMKRGLNYFNWSSPRLCHIIRFDFVVSSGVASFFGWSVSNRGASIYPFDNPSSRIDEMNSVSIKNEMHSSPSSPKELTSTLKSQSDSASVQSQNQPPRAISGTWKKDVFKSTSNHSAKELVSARPPSTKLIEKQTDSICYDDSGIKPDTRSSVFEFNSIFQEEGSQEQQTVKSNFSQSSSVKAPGSTDHVFGGILSSSLKFISQQNLKSATSHVFANEETEGQHSTNSSSSSSLSTFGGQIIDSVNEISLSAEERIELRRRQFAKNTKKDFLSKYRYWETLEETHDPQASKEAAAEALKEQSIEESIEQPCEHAQREQPIEQSVEQPVEQPVERTDERAGDQVDKQQEEQTCEGDGGAR